MSIMDCVIIRVFVSIEKQCSRTVHLQKLFEC